MGLSASQARLLSITARLSDNELHSQQIANSKVRLADKTQEASREYIEALSATKLMYTTYDAKGNATQTALTPAIMYEFSDLKNQYGISNTSGQLLVPASDAANYEKSKDVNDFVQCYGVELKENPKYIRELKSIYGEEYNEYFDTENNASNVNFGGLDVPGWLGKPNNAMSEQSYNDWANQISVVNKTVNGKEAGSYGSLISKLTSVPEYPGDEPPAPEKVDMPDFTTLTKAYNNSVCYTSVGTSDSGIGHMEHNLAALIWSVGGLGTDTKSITNSNNTITITNKETECGTNHGFSLTNYDFSDPGQAKPLLEALRGASDYECVKELMQSVIDLYCDVINYMSVNNVGTSTTHLDSSAFTMTKNAPIKSANELKQSWDKFYQDLAGLKQKAEAEYNEKYQKKLEEYEIKHKQWENDWAAINTWSENCKALYNNYEDAIKKLSTPKIPDENDPKTEWYINLWHRMNGESDFKSTEGQTGAYYKQLDDNLLTNQDWLKFALEHGVVTLEKVTFVEEAEDITGLKTSKWQSTMHNTCADISEVDDEIAVARAEAEYTKKLNEIEAKDKKYDNDIKKLDTEHNALQTEYESVKGVIDKNVERSFKAFS